MRYSRMLCEYTVLACIRMSTCVTHCYSCHWQCQDSYADQTDTPAYLSAEVWTCDGRPKGYIRMARKVSRYRTIERCSWDALLRCTRLEPPCWQAHARRSSGSSVVRRCRGQSSCVQLQPLIPAAPASPTNFERRAWPGPMDLTEYAQGHVRDSSWAHTSREWYADPVQMQPTDSMYRPCSACGSGSQVHSILTPAVNTSYC